MAPALAALAVGAYAAVAATSATKIRVTEKEFKIGLARTTAAHGKVTFVVRNTGKLRHEFVVLKTKLAPNKLPLKGATAVEVGRVGKIPPFGPGQTRTLTLPLKAGKYVLICNVPAHYQAGQRVGFRVT